MTRDWFDALAHLILGCSLGHSPFSDYKSEPHPLPHRICTHNTRFTMSNHDTRLSRSLGAILGVHAGDSLGATLEFEYHSTIKQKYPDGLQEIVGGGSFSWPPGHATDDTDLTRAVLLAYSDRRKHCETRAGREGSEFDVVKAAADYSLAWLTGDWPDREPGSMPVDIGCATQTGLSNYDSTGDATRSGAGPGSAGNGSLMRCIPTALFSDSKEVRVRESMAISAITHNDTRCTVSCAAYNEMIAAMIQGKKVREAVEQGRLVAQEQGQTQVEAAISRGETLDLAKLADQGPKSAGSDITTGYVLNGLTLAVAALLDPRSFKDVLVDVVRLGGDADTNGAIAGGALGARDGKEKIPESWLETLQFGDEFEVKTKWLLSE